MYLTGLITADGVIDGNLASRTERIEADGRTFKYRITDTVTILQNDIRAIQLAKAALHAGFKLLMDCLLYTSPSPRDTRVSRMPSSA